MEMQQKAELDRMASEKDELKREMKRKLENALKRGCSALACDACNTKVSSDRQLALREPRLKRFFKKCSAYIYLLSRVMLATQM